jgi:hypothetical protein
VLCAHLDSWAESANAHWLALGSTALENYAGQPPHTNDELFGCAARHPGLSRRALAHWLAQPSSRVLHLQSSATPRLAVEFAQI